MRVKGESMRVKGESMRTRRDGVSWFSSLALTALVACGGESKRAVQVDAEPRVDEVATGASGDIAKMENAGPADAQAVEPRVAVPVADAQVAKQEDVAPPRPNPEVTPEAPRLAPGSRPYPGSKDRKAVEASADGSSTVGEPPEPGRGMTAASVVPAPPPPKPAPAPLSPAQAKLVARGAYVASISGCAVCHAERVAFGVKPRPFAGGFTSGQRTGLWRAPNITQDKKYGIGAWTDAEIIAAVREGKRPDGSQLYAVMPFTYFNAMTDSDAQALVAYLRTIEPADNLVEGNPVLKMAKVEVPPTERKTPKTKAEQGQYLAALMHCGLCHRKEGPPVEWYGIGGEVGAEEIFPPHVEARAPKYRPPWGVKDIKDAIDEARKAPTPFGPMGIYGPSWRQLTDEDLDALAEFLKATPTPATP